MPEAGLSSVTSDGTLSGDGTSANPLSVVSGGGGGLSSVASNSTLSGNGTPSNPLGVATPLTTAEKTKIANSLTVVSSGSTITGNGTSGSPLNVATPLTIAEKTKIANSLTVVSSDGTITGTGTTASPLRVATPLTSTEKTRIANSLVAVSSDGTLSGTGTPSNPLSVVGGGGGGDTAGQIVTKLESLTGDDRLDASAVKNIPSGGGGSEGVSTFRYLHLDDPTRLSSTRSLFNIVDATGYQTGDTWDGWDKLQFFASQSAGAFASSGPAVIFYPGEFVATGESFTFESGNNLNIVTVERLSNTQIAVTAGDTNDVFFGFIAERYAHNAGNPVRVSYTLAVDQNVAGAVGTPYTQAVESTPTLEVNNEDTEVSVASNEFTLKPGTWQIEVSIPTANYTTNARKTVTYYLYDSTNTSVVAQVLSSGYLRGATGSFVSAPILGGMVTFYLTHETSFNLLTQAVQSEATSIIKSHTAQKGTVTFTKLVVGPKGNDGEPGAAGQDGLNGRDGTDGTNGKDGSPDTGEEIVTKLSGLSGDDRLPASAIRDLPTTPDTPEGVEGDFVIANVGSVDVSKPYVRIVDSIDSVSWTDAMVSVDMDDLRGRQLIIYNDTGTKLTQPVRLIFDHQNGTDSYEAADTFLP